MKHILLTTLTVFVSTVAVAEPQAEYPNEINKTLATLADTTLSEEEFVEKYRDVDSELVEGDRDQCPNSYRQRDVDAIGCELDSDSDGIFDHNDQCPETPQGYSVNFLGCAADSDDDGVIDEKDRCPMTLLGTIVDQSGCKSAHDQDQDGVLDAQDKCPNTPRSSEVNEHGCVPQAMALAGIVFDTNSYVLRPDQQPQLEQNLAVLKKVGEDEVIYIAGHTDSVGRDALNLTLSWNRAMAVKKYLVTHAGVDSGVVYVEGFGEAKPIAENTSREGRQSNRRIEIQVLPVTELPPNAQLSALILAE